jgi:hypothetical protein
MTDPRQVNGVAPGQDQREVAIDLIENVWRHAARSNGTDAVIPIQLANAQVAALLYVGDELRKLREDMHVRSYHR